MNDAFWAAAVTAGASVLCQLFIDRRSAGLTAYRLTQLESKMDKHNDFIRRLTACEVRLEALSQELGRVENGL